MNATQISPSQSIEASLLGHHNSTLSPGFTSQSAPQEPPPPPPPPPPPDAAASSPAPPPPPPPTEQLAATSDQDDMDHQPSPPPALTPQQQSPQPSDSSGGQDHDRMNLDAEHSTQNAGSQTSQALPVPATPRSASQGPSPDLQTPSSIAEVLVAAQADSNVLEGEHASATGSAAPLLAPARGPTTTAVPRSAGNSPDGEDDDENDDDDEPSDDDDNSSYDGDREFLSSMVEDETGPNEEELKQLLNSDPPERSALDQAYWESMVYTPLDDPEYTPLESGTITWTLQGFHGTKDAPNRQRIMRSPVVNVGGYQWNLKVFPHGNEGTDQVSVYIECTGEVGSANPVVAAEDDVAMQGMSGESSLPSDGVLSDKDKCAETPSPKSTWEVAAQIGCVMYNPQEPRVHVFEKASHQFQSTSQDWGWVRFHGPWRDLHLRRPFQRQAILRNDTLAFTAFVRIVKDPTRALWWRQGDQASWDSVAKTGLRSLTAENTAHNAFVAALAPWFHMAPFRKLLLETQLPDLRTEPPVRPKPLVEHLQDVIFQKHCPTGSSAAVNLFLVEKILQAYGFDFKQSTEVIEVWEMLRHYLNKEIGTDSDESVVKTDALSFMRTIKQKWIPELPTGSGGVLQEASSVQEILDALSAGEASNYEDWEGYDDQGPRWPEVLQVELHRQRFDVEARKWKRLTHKIKMDETVKVCEKEYTLSGMIISKGELGSGRMYPIVRSGGPKSQWARYKSGHVTYLTRKQAVECHEGKGWAREGTESVAYVVIYVRSDAAAHVLPEPIVQPTSKVFNPIDAKAYSTTAAVAQDRPIQVFVHKESSFLEHTKGGFVDPYSADSRNIYRLSLPHDATLADVQEELVNQFQVAENPGQCRLWAFGPQTSLPFQPGSSLTNHIRNMELASVGFKCAGLHLWLHVIPQPLFEADRKAEEEKAKKDTAPPRVTFPVPPPPPPPPPPVVISPSAPVERQNEDVVMGGTDERSSNNQNPAGQPSLNVTENVVPSGEASQESLPRPMVNLMAELIPQDSLHLLMTGPGGPESGSRGSSESEAGLTPIAVLPSPHWAMQDQAYFFMKLFSPKTQTLRPLGCFMSPWSEKLSSFVSKTGLSFTSSPKVYFETGLRLDDSYLTIDSVIHPHNLPMGTTIVLSDTDVSENDLEIIRSRGDATDAKDYYEILGQLSKFPYQGSTVTESFFGGSYSYKSLYRGRAHGRCTIIDTNGDAYVGNCIGGHKAGEGTMYYSNGDTYTGLWQNSLPHGQGTMVYHGTSNKYVGGWRAGRRHGKGVMTFEVADEEMALCKICYEAEMDALFFRCGHVAACEACARQVRDCPVCRRTVDAVVKIWKM